MISKYRVIKALVGLGTFLIVTTPVMFVVSSLMTAFGLEVFLWDNPLFLLSFLFSQIKFLVYHLLAGLSLIGGAQLLILISKLNTR